MGATRTAGVTPTSSSTYGNLVTAAGSAHVKGSWTELIAATAFDTMGIFLNVRAGPVNRFLVDLGVGAAAAEEVVVPDLLLWSNDAHVAPGIYLPLRIPAGARVSARCQSSAASQQVAAHLILLGRDGAWDYPPTQRPVTALGVDTANTRGTTLTAHASGTGFKGAWSQLVAALAHDVEWLALVLGVDNKGVGTTNHLDVGVGAAAAEKVVVPDLRITIGAPVEDAPYPLCVVLPVHLPAGARVAARLESSGASNQADLMALAVGR